MKRALLMLLLAMLMAGCASGRLIDQVWAQEMTFTVDGKDYTLKFSSSPQIVYLENGRGRMLMVGSEGKMAYPKPKTLLPTDSDAAELRKMGFARLRTPVTHCVIKQLNEKVLLCDAGSAFDDYSIGHLSKEGAEGAVAGRITLIPTVFADGAIHEISGTITMGGYTFVSSDEDRLIFECVDSKGYAYKKGKGTVKTPGGEVVELGARVTEFIAGSASKKSTKK
jgi:hypothetical protein